MTTRAGPKAGRGRSRKAKGTMKLDKTLEMWYAWQEGNSSLLAGLIKEKLGPKYTARIPSVAWGYYHERSESVIVRTVMLSNEWVVYMPLTATISTYWAFVRSGGPPAAELGKLPYRNFIMIID